MTSITANYYSTTEPNYRRYELPWSRIEEETERLRKILLGVLGVLLLLSVIIPFLPVAEIERNTATDIPPRLAKLVIEKKLPPPPPPPEVKPEPKPEVAVPKAVPPPAPKPVVVPPPVVAPPVAKVIVPEEKVEPVVVPVEAPTQDEVIRQTREKVKKVGLLAVADDLTALRENNAVTNTSNRNLSAAVSSSERTERALITSGSSTRSAGVNTAALSRTAGGGGLAGRSTTAVSAPVSVVATSPSGGSSGSTSDGGGSSASGYGGQRSQEQIETVFDKNKAAIYALYRRALRKDPTLQGKLVLQLTIAPSGKVLDCSVVSSELNSPEFEANLIRRVKLFDFGAQDVGEITTTKPIDFFPA